MDRLEAEKVLREADALYSAAEVEAAFDRMALAIAALLRERSPVVLPVMIGGLVPAGRLLARLDFPLELDYVHATRYEGGVKGESLRWRTRPGIPLRDRVVLVIDDILDEGFTLAAILEHCRAEGAREVYSAVLVHKHHDRRKAVEKADFTGLEIGDRYVFGSGMDYHGYLRNVSGIYAVRGL